jgi:hypothetical protein
MLNDRATRRPKNVGAERREDRFVCERSQQRSFMTRAR